MIDHSTKQQIKIELVKQVALTGSQNLTAKRIGVSSAYVSRIINDEFEVISDAFWRKLSRLLGMSLYEQWQHADTKPALKLQDYFDDSRTFGNVFALVGNPGTGKTDMLDYYSKTHKNVFYVKAESDMTKRIILRRLLSATGYHITSGNDNTMLELLKKQVLALDRPLILLDEMETVKNRELLLLKDLYNALWKRCGITAIGTKNLKNRITNGAERGLLGFNELLSRFGGNMYELPELDDEDAYLVIKENGISDPLTVAAIANGSKDKNGLIDLRIVERKVHAHKQKEAHNEN